MMKRFLIIAFILLMVGSLYAEEKKIHWTYRSLQWIYYGLNYADFGITSYVIHTGQGIELNPVMNLYLENSVLAFGIVTIQNVITHVLTNWLYKKSKVLGYGMLIALAVVKGYAIGQGIPIFK